MIRKLTILLLACLTAAACSSDKEDYLTDGLETMQQQILGTWRIVDSPDMLSFDQTGTVCKGINLNNLNSCTRYDVLKAGSGYYLYLYAPAGGIYDPGYYQLVRFTDSELHFTRGKLYIECVRTSQPLP